nr:MAG TPA: hypothetical protein [Caudoviricetes sp.]
MRAGLTFFYSINISVKLNLLPIELYLYIVTL